MTAILVSATRDIDVVSSLLAQAFADDPVIRWLQPDPARDRAIHRTLLRWAHGASSPIDLAVRDGEPIGAAVWDPPGHRLSTGARLVGMADFVRVLGRRFRRGAILEEKFVKLRPTEPHWYLGQVGAAAPGRGAGTALLRHGIERVDAMGAPAYLESSNVANIPLYERFGFEVVDEIALPYAGPSVWPMFRRG